MPCNFFTCLFFVSQLAGYVDARIRFLQSPFLNLSTVTNRIRNFMRERFSWSFLAATVASAVELVSMKKITDGICFRRRIRVP
ncbi:hypothetical protein J1N35_042782 [Gossypium stocksii]|uniref:Secreted protein n=1 Tax=Gossypium stocksii TaxID=47602 RepID=A0A9D3ZET3_9ROSI|nr:hypothetical protein J1N35_042782 [Gossypium stocksii]